MLSLQSGAERLQQLLQNLRRSLPLCRVVGGGLTNRDRHNSQFIRLLMRFATNYHGKEKTIGANLQQFQQNDNNKKKTDLTDCRRCQLGRCCCTIVQRNRAIGAREMDIPSPNNEIRILVSLCVHRIQLHRKIERKEALLLAHRTVPSH